MTTIDELIRQTLAVPENDGAEHEGLAQAHAALESRMSESAAPAHRPRRTRRLRAGLRLVPAVAICVLVLVIAVGAVVLVHHRSESQAASRTATTSPTTTTAVTPTATALIARLAVLRRPQTPADRLPADLIRGWKAFSEINGLGGQLLPRLSRLVSDRGGVKLYLVVTTPSGVLFNASEGDQVTVLEVSRGRVDSDELQIPAEALSDSTIITGLSRPGTPQVSIVPDGVARVVWTVLKPGARSRVQIDVPVHDNLAQLPASAAQRVDTSLAAWYTADGRRVDTTPALNEAYAARQENEYRQALRAGTAQPRHGQPQILDAFSVFSFTSPTGTRISDGYVISQPPLDQLPLAVLNLAERSSSIQPRRGPLDLRQTRKVLAPSGLSMYIVPGPHDMCDVETGIFEEHDTPEQAIGGGGGCGSRLAAVLEHGVGGESGGQKGWTYYILVPKAHPTRTYGMPTPDHTIRPEDGVAIISPR